MSKINLKLFFFCLLLLHAAIGFSQIEMTLDSLGKRTMSLFEMEQDSSLSVHQKDSIQYLRIIHEGEYVKYIEKKDSILLLIGIIDKKLKQLEDIEKSIFEISKIERDSLLNLIAYKRENLEASLRYTQAFLEKRDTILLLLKHLKASSGEQTQFIYALINIANNADVYPHDRISAISQLAASRHPIALTFLMENIMNIGYPDPDPPSYGRTAIYDDYYVQYDAYPCVNALRQQAGWHLLPYFETAIEKKVIPEAYIILYAFLLDDIMKNCKPCLEAFLTGYKEYPERTEAIRIRTINARQIMEFYKNPKKN